MAELPWWSWLGVGLFVSIASAFGGLSFFVWVGLVFVVVGIYKMVSVFILSEKQTFQRPHKPQASSHQQTVYCPQCRVSVLATDYFCRLCGRRLR